MPRDSEASANGRIARLAGVLAARRTDAGPVIEATAEAAVAIVLRMAAEPAVLLIRRTERDGDPWSGHIAFPGGRRSAADPDLLATALRETREETGLDLEPGTVIGQLDDVFTPSRLPRLRVAAWVVVAPAESLVKPDPREVLDAAWVPIRALTDPGASSHIDVDHSGTAFRFPSLVHDEYVIWGMTHRILSQFLERLAEAGF